MKEGENDFTGIVMGNDAMRNVASPTRGGLMLIDHHFQCNDRAFLRKSDAGTVAPVDHTMRWQKEKLANSRLRTGNISAQKFTKQGSHFRTNAGKRADGSEKRIKHRRTHGGEH
ncbi:hypothetical protein D3C80_487090 [compost metagenome]